MEEQQATVISFINLKGGVGKTSSAINIADELSRQGYKTLVIDMDPQFNATQALLNHQYRYQKHVIAKELLDQITEQLKKDFEHDFEELSAKTEDDEADVSYQEELSSQLIYNTLKSQRMTIRSLFANEAIVEPLPDASLVYKIKDNLDLIPGDLDLFESLSGDTSGKHNVLDDHFEANNFRTEYHFIIIDCPPNWTILTQASLFSSDYYIIPSKIDLFSSIGIALLEKLVGSTFYEKRSSIYRMYSMYKKDLGREHIQSLGVLFTLTHEMVIADKLKSELKQNINQPFLDTEIPYHPSVPLKFSLYDESGSKHETLKNAITKVVEEIITVTQN